MLTITRNCLNLFSRLVSDLIHCTNEMNVNIPQLADSLFERTTNTSWVVVFKSLTTTHHLMVYGNEVRTVTRRLCSFKKNKSLNKPLRSKRLQCQHCLQMNCCEQTELKVKCFLIYFYSPAEIYTVSGFEKHTIQPQ